MEDKLMREWKKKTWSVIAKTVYANARKEANSACVLFGYQPKISKKTKEKIKGKL